MIRRSDDGLTSCIAPIAFKYRGLLWGIFAVGALAFPAEFSASRCIAGVLFALAGQGVRFWAAGLIPKYRTLVVDAPVLVTDGPYALVRNPLYAGNALLGIGWSTIAGWWWLLAFVAAFAAIYGAIIIPHEEKFLADRFGAEYERYRGSTPTLIPSISKLLGIVCRRDGVARKKIAAKFDSRRSWSMERHSLRMNILVTALLAARLFFF